MINDLQDEFTTTGSQVCTGAAAIGTKVKNAGAAKDWGAGELKVPFVRIDVASDVVTSMKFDIIAADDAALTTNAVVLSTITVLTAALTADSLHAMPALLAGYERQYLGCKFTPAGGNGTVGTFICGLSGDKDGRPQGAGGNTL